MNERDETRLFRTLDPPPGGLADLRRRITGRRRRRAWTMRVATATAGVAIAALAVWLALPAGNGAEHGIEFGDDLLAVRLGLAEPPSEPVSVRPGQRGTYAVERVPTTDDRVVMYRFGSR